MSRTALAAVILVLLAGCGAKASRENSRLRAQVMDLEAEVESLTARNRELETALAETRAAAGDRTIPPDVQAAIPYVAVVEIDRKSYARDTDGDGRVDELVVYVKPLDGRRRFVQMAGSLTVTATVIVPDAEPVILARAELDPAQLRDAYRSSFMGTHYRVVLPLPADVPEGPVAISVTYEDGRTGRTIDALREIDLQP
jgi:outer membrane murein-binding lipoprotein Lpp